MMVLDQTWTISSVIVLILFFEIQFFNRLELNLLMYKLKLIKDGSLTDVICGKC